MSIVDLDSYEEEETEEMEVEVESQGTEEDAVENEDLPSDSMVFQGLVDTSPAPAVDDNVSAFGENTRSAPNREYSYSRRSSARRPSSSAALLRAKASISSPASNPRRASLLGLPPSAHNLIDDGDDDEGKGHTESVSVDHVDPLNSQNAGASKIEDSPARVKQAILNRSAQRHSPGANGDTITKQAIEERAGEIAMRRSGPPPAVAVRGPGARDPSSISFDDPSLVSMPEALVARVVSRSGARIDESERRRIIEDAQLEVWEQIEHTTQRAQIVAVMDDEPNDGNTIPAVDSKPRTRPRNTRNRVVLLVVFIVTLVVGVGAIFLSRNNRSIVPPSAVVSFLRDVSYETKISYPVPENNPTPAEQAVAWIEENLDVENFNPEAISSMERTSLIQKFVLASLWFQSARSKSEDVEDGWFPYTCGEDDDILCDEVFIECYSDDVLRCNGDGHIDELSLDSEMLQGTIPKDLALLTRLTHLDLSDNSLSGAIPTELFQLTNIRNLWLDDNSLTGSIPTEVGMIKMTENIALATNSLRGGIPSVIGELTLLTELHIGFNRLSGTLPSQLGFLAELEFFYAGENVLTGKLPSQLSAWNHIREIDLHLNELTGGIPESLRAGLGNLEILELDENLLSGPLEDVIGNWTLLRALNVAVNDLTGSVPTSIAQLESLEAFVVQTNALDGSLPSVIGQVTTLTHIFVGANSLNGTLPSELGRLTNMITLDCYGNFLSGSLPTELGRWTAIESFEVEENKLTGVIPMEYSKWTSLTKGYFHRNHFTGDMPFCGTSIDTDQLDLMANCNDVKCECCSSCCYQRGDPICCDDMLFEQDQNDDDGCCNIDDEDVFCE